MDNPTILYEASKLHYGEIKKESESWRLAIQAKTARPRPVKRVNTASKTLLKKIFLRQKRDEHMQGDGWILTTKP